MLDVNAAVAICYGTAPLDGGKLATYTQFLMTVV
jgi:hypothetical protein